MAPKGRKGTVISTKEIEQAKANNPVGIRVIEFTLKGPDFYRDQSTIAGYIVNCPNTETLRSIVTSLNPLFEKYAVLRANGWTSVQTGAAVEAQNPAASSLFRFLHRLNNNRLAAEILNDDDPEPNLEKMTEAFGPMEPKIKRDITGYLVTTNILIKVIVQKPQHFRNPFQFDVEQGMFIPNAEDLNRAYALLRTWSRQNEEARKNKGKSSKLQNNPARDVHYLSDEITEHGEVQDSTFSFDDVITYEAPSAPPSEDGESLDELEIVTLMDKGVDDEKIIESEKIISVLPPLTELEKASLYRYAKENLNIRYDKWDKVGTDGEKETEVSEELRNIIQKVHDDARQFKEEGVEQEGADKDDKDPHIGEILDHASLPTHTTSQAADYLGLDVTRPALFPELHSSVVLLSHQLTGVSTMSERERKAYEAFLKNKPTLQACILGDNMGLGKTMEILALIYLVYRDGVQVKGPRVAPPAPTLVCIPPGIALMWYSDYNRFFSNHLKMYFVGSSFRHGADPMFQSICIDQEIFEQAVNDPKHSPLFRKPEDVGRTIFVVSHFTLTKFTLNQEVETTLLSQDNNVDEAQISDLQANRKVMRTPKKTKPKVFNTEEEDATLVEQDNSYEKFLVNFSSRFPQKFFRVVIDEGSVVRNPSSGISRAVKLLEAPFLWIMSATPLLNKTRDFYGYSQLLYNVNWELDLSEEFFKQKTIEKFSKATDDDEFLELFNPIHIRRLATNGHLDPSVAAVVIPVLLRKCMIRRTADTVIDGKAIRDNMPKKDINSVVLTLNRAEQIEYCEMHQKNTREPLETFSMKEGRLERNMDARRVKNLLCASFCPRFATFHRRVGQAKTKAGKLKSLMATGCSGLPFFLKNTHDEKDYQYVVPNTRIGRALELLNISPSLRYVCMVLFKIVTQQNRRLVLIAETVGWLTLVFCQNYGEPTEWLRGGSTQAERDRILTDFTNINGSTKVLISTHKVGGFGLNLQSGCCHMVILELSQHLNGLLQTQARLLRIGQEEDVRIWILFTDHTFQRWWASNLAKKAISDLSAQLASKLSADEQADPLTIEKRGEEALNIILGWKECRSHWNNLHELDLEKSCLSSFQQQKYASIGRPPTKPVQSSVVETGKKRKREKDVSEKSKSPFINSEIEQDVVPGQESSLSSPLSSYAESGLLSNYADSEQNVVLGQQISSSTTHAKTQGLKKAKIPVKNSNSGKSATRKSKSKLPPQTSRVTRSTNQKLKSSN